MRHPLSSTLWHVRVSNASIIYENCDSCVQLMYCFCQALRLFTVGDVNSVKLKVLALYGLLFRLVIKPNYLVPSLRAD